MTEPLRLFFGLDATAQTTALLELQHQLAINGSPVAADNLHLTLVFLGLVKSERLPELEQIAVRTLQQLQPAPFRLELDRPGLFPQAKVAWVAPSQPPLMLTQLESALREQLIHAGFPLDERPYRPHVTLYRKARTLPACQPAPIQLTIEAMHLYESRSTPDGVRYIKLASWPFSSNKQVR